MRQLRNFGFLMLVSLASLSTLCAQRISFPLVISDGLQNDTLTMGFQPGMSFCFLATDTMSQNYIAPSVKNGISETEAPPAPPGGNFFVVFKWPRTGTGANTICYGPTGNAGSYNDFRPYVVETQKDTFRITGQVGNGPSLTMSWPADLATRFQHLYLVQNSGSFPGNLIVDMLTTTNSGDLTSLVGDPATVRIFSDGLIPPPAPHPVFNVLPALHNFGNVAVGSTADFAFNVSNTGDLDLHVTGVTPSNPAYTVLETVPQTILPGGNFNFTVHFAPTSGGTANGTVTFTDDATNNLPHQVTVQGVGIAPVVIAPLTATFANTVVGCTVTQTNVFTMTNNATATVNVTGVTSSDPQFSVSPTTASIVPAGTQQFSVTFVPTGGAVSATLSFDYTGAPGTPLTVNATGTGTAPFAVTPPTLAFGSVQISGLPPCLPTSFRDDAITVHNNSCTAAFDVTGMTGGPVAYTVLDAFPINVPSLGTATIHIRFAPTVTGAQNGSFSIAYSGYGSPSSVNVTGSGAPCVEPLFTTVTPESLSILVNNYFQRPVYRVRTRPAMPNWANLMQEAVVQGAFQPNSSESDSAGGMRVGLSFMRHLRPTVWVAQHILRDSAWVRLTQWVASRGGFGGGYAYLQTTLLSKTIGGIVKHDAFPRGLDSAYNPGAAHRTPLKGQYTLLSPVRGKNQLFAELVALKFNIAASVLGKTTNGFGELHFNLTGNPCDGLTIVQISAKIDSALTLWRGRNQAYYDGLNTAAHLINIAFVGPMDTVSFYVGNALVVKGVRGVSSVPYLSPATDMPTILVPTTDAVTSEIDEISPIEDPIDGSIPSVMTLYQNYPNPFNPSTSISFHLMQPAQVTVRVYNVLGQQVATLLDNEVMSDGFQSIRFDAGRLASGVYLYTVTGQELETGAAIAPSVGKMMLLK